MLVRVSNILTVDNVIKPETVAEVNIDINTQILFSS